MKVQIITKNYKASEKLQANIEKKFEKLGKFFNDDVTATVVLSRFREATKLEATIKAKNNIFRAEEISDNEYEAMDIAIAKLSNQMAKFKGKLESRYQKNEALKFEFIPEVDEDVEEEISVIKRKHFELEPMVAEEAILQMEMLGHDFFVYFDMDTESVNVVYKRKGDAYGLIETAR